MIKIFFEEDVEDEYNLQVLFNLASKILSQDANMQVDICFLREDEMQQLNLQARNIDKVTDVLSFPNLSEILGVKIAACNYPHDIDLETNSICLGSIAICIDVAKQQSVEFGHSIEREISYLAIHGLLHLFGYDHETQCDKVTMREMEEKILSSINIERLQP